MVTPRARSTGLWGGLVLLGVLNYLDLVGVLRLGLTDSLVAVFAIVWAVVVLIVAGLRELEEIRVYAVGLLVASGAIVAVGVSAWLFAPDAGRYAVFHATPLGQVYSGLAPAFGWPTVLLVTWFVWGWLAEYVHLMRTTPEQRVLGEDHGV